MDMTIPTKKDLIHIASITVTLCKINHIYVMYRYSL